MDRIYATKLRHELTAPDTFSISSAPYLGGPKAREFVEARIEKIPLINVTEPARSEWAPVIAFAAKEDCLP